MNRIQQRLGVETSKNSVNTDFFTKILLDGKERVLPIGEVNKVLNIGEQFNKERQKSSLDSDLLNDATIQESHKTSYLNQSSLRRMMI